jgi:hypothetical protein
MTNPVAIVRAVDHAEISYDCLMFICPGCKVDKDWGSGLHMLPITNTYGKRPQWTFDGNLESPTLSPSILTRSNWKEKEIICHSFLVAGVFDFLSDCTHSLAGKKVPMEPLPDWVIK